MLTQTWNLINFHFTQLIRIFLINVRYFYFIDFPCILYILPIRNFYCFSIQKFLFSYILLLNLCKQINTSSSVKQVENSIFKTKPLSKIIMYSRLDEPQAELYIRGICKHRKVYQVNKKFIDFISLYFDLLFRFYCSVLHLQCEAFLPYFLLVYLVSVISIQFSTDNENLLSLFPDVAAVCELPPKIKRGRNEDERFYFNLIFHFFSYIVWRYGRNFLFWCFNLVHLQFEMESFFHCFHKYYWNRSRLVCI